MPEIHVDLCYSCIQKVELYDDHELCRDCKKKLYDAIRPYINDERAKGRSKNSAANNISQMLTVVAGSVVFTSYVTARIIASIWSIKLDF